MNLLFVVLIVAVVAVPACFASGWIMGCVRQKFSCGLAGPGGPDDFSHAQFSFERHRAGLGVVRANVAGVLPERCLGGCAVSRREMDGGTIWESRPGERVGCRVCGPLTHFALVREIACYLSNMTAKQSVINVCASAPLRSRLGRGF